MLLDANPLADISRTGGQTGVVAGGRWLARAEVERRLTTHVEPPDADAPSR